MGWAGARLEGVGRVIGGKELVVSSIYTQLLGKAWPRRGGRGMEQELEGVVVKGRALGGAGGISGC